MTAADLSARARDALAGLLSAAGVGRGDPDRDAGRLRDHLWREFAVGEPSCPLGCGLAIWFREQLAPLKVAVGRDSVLVTDASVYPVRRAVVPLPECVRLAVAAVDGRREPGLLEDAA